jgi:primosomal protein N' (replication factor Y)
VDIPLAHLDRPFDYLIPERLSAAASPGCRVRIRFAGQLTDGYLLERTAASDHPGKLAYLERVVSPEPVLTPEIAALAREVADRYAGTLADVLRLAIPPRHARVESEPAPTPGNRSGRRGGTTGSPRADRAARSGTVVAVPGRPVVPRRARRQPGAARRVVRAARPGLA